MVSASRGSSSAPVPTFWPYRRSISNIELVWEHEFYRRFFEYIARHVRITAFDKRGIGLSDKFHEAPTLEQRTTDILAVTRFDGHPRSGV